MTQKKRRQLRRQKGWARLLVDLGFCVVAARAVAAEFVFGLLIDSHSVVEPCLMHVNFHLRESKMLQLFLARYRLETRYLSLEKGTYDWISRLDSTLI